MKIFKKEREVGSLALEYLETATRCVVAGEASVLAYLGDEIDAASVAQKEAASISSPR